MSPRGRALLRSLLADIDGLRFHRDDNPVEAETIRAAIVAELIEMHQTSSLTERAMGIDDDIPWPNEAEMAEINARNIAEAAQERRRT